MTVLRVLAAAGVAAVVIAASRSPRRPPADEHLSHMMSADLVEPTVMGTASQGAANLPPSFNNAAARLTASPRHGEWVKIAWEPGSKDSLMAWVVYPSTSSAKSPVVVVVHEIFGLATWVRGVADQVAAEGFIAIAPDLNSRARGGPSTAELSGDSARKLISGVDPSERNRGISAAANYAMGQPSAEHRYAVIGYCWGGSTVFIHAVNGGVPGFSGGVAFYGLPYMTTPAAGGTAMLVGDSLAKIKTPVMLLNGSKDARIATAMPALDSAMKALHKDYVGKNYEGAVHGFLRAQDDPKPTRDPAEEAANLAATKDGWPRTVAFLKKNLGGEVAMRFLGFLVLLSVPASAQQPPGNQPKFGPGGQGSPNIHISSHVPLGAGRTLGDIEIEQEMSRPYVYVSRMSGETHDIGFTIVSLKDPKRAKVIYDWRLENRELMDAYGGLRGSYFKLKGRYYYAQSFQIRPGSPSTDLGAVIFDVTTLPDTTGVKEVGRIRDPQHIGGIHNLTAYKHSDGRVLLFTTSTASFARIYDMEKFLALGDQPGARIAEIPIPNDLPAPDPVPGVRVLNITGTYHDFYLGYDPATHQDKFYGSAWSAGYFIYDVTRPEEPKLITSVTGTAGGGSYHTFTPTPDGRYAVGEQEYLLSPLRIYDLKPGLDGSVKTISRPIGAWTPNWRDLVHNTEVRWPYVFVSGYEDGLQVFNMMDPTNPYTVGYYFTYEGQRTSASDGVFGIDVRNADGMIVVSDKYSGFWSFKMDGFDGWNGHQWGMPNVSSAQDWDNGPEGVPKSARVSVR